MIAGVAGDRLANHQPVEQLHMSSKVIRLSPMSWPAPGRSSSWPHRTLGPALTLMERVRFLAWEPASARDLITNRPELRALNFGYREFAHKCGDQLAHLAFYEMADTGFGRIVDPASADPGLSELGL